MSACVKDWKRLSCCYKKELDKIGTEECKILKTKGAVKEHDHYFYKFFASRGGCRECKYNKICWSKNKGTSKKFAIKQSVYDNYFMYKNMQRKL